MRRILLEYKGQKVIESVVKHHYQHITFKKSKRQPKDFYFDQMVFPYNVVGSIVQGTKQGSEIQLPYYVGDHLVQTFQLFPYHKRPHQTGPFERLFALVNPKGQYIITDPVTDQQHAVTDVSLLQLWDTHYPVMEDHFKAISQPIRYLTEQEMSHLTFS